MELKFWIYIFVVVVYVVRWAMKKAGEKAMSPQDPRPVVQRKAETPASSEGTKPLTFEELLREITEGKVAKNQPKPAYVDYEDNPKEEEKDLEVIPDGRFYNENTKREAFRRPSLEETLKLEDTNMTFGKFKAFNQEQEHTILQDYIREFQDPAGFKKAFVLSEVLKTKF